MFDMSASMLFASLAWGAVGSGFFIYGWKQRLTLPAFCGIGITAASYFCPTALLMSMACIAIIALFWWLKKREQ